jgi:serine/threonine protein phosphatase PrpC
MEKLGSALETLVENDFAIEAGITGMQGYRFDMEDGHIHAKMADAPDHLFLGVFDGHCGDGCAIYVCGTNPKREPSQKSLTEVLQETQEWKDYLASANADGTGRNIELLKDALTEAFKAIDRQMKQYLEEDPEKDDLFGGCTAVTVMITPEWIVCANAGDSRATMCHKGGINMVLSEDHKPNNEEEKARINAAGGFVQDNRVDGFLAVSRGLGDFCLKDNESKEPAGQKVSCVPDFYQYKRSPNEEEMIILACDGLWDVFSNDQAIEEVRQIWAEGETNTVLVAEELIDRALFAGSRDNISAIVVKMKAAEVSAVGGGVADRRRDRIGTQGGNEKAK